MGDGSCRAAERRELANVLDSAISSLTGVSKSAPVARRDADAHDACGTRDACGAHDAYDHATLSGGVVAAVRGVLIASERDGPRSLGWNEAQRAAGVAMEEMRAAWGRFVDARDRAVVLLSSSGGGDVLEEGACSDRGVVNGAQHLAAWLELGGMWEVAGAVGRVVEVLCQVDRVLTGAEIEAVEGVVGLLRD